MDKLVFLDTETTGNEPIKDFLVQLCFLHGDQLEVGNFRPPVPISVKAQSIHHITNKMTHGWEEFKTSKMKADLEKVLAGKILVAHNAPYDIAIISKEGVKTGDFICTLKVTRFLDEEGVIPEYKLQYLRYFWELEIKDAYAHDARSDVLVLKAVFDKLYQLMKVRLGSENGVIEKMMEVSKLPFLIRSFNFGKYKGRRVDEIVQLDRGYLSWLLEQKLQGNGDEEDWIYTLKHYLQVK